jgi:hypothetical protein
MKPVFKRPDTTTLLTLMRGRRDLRRPDYQRSDETWRVLERVAFESRDTEACVADSIEGGAVAMAAVADADVDGHHAILQPGQLLLV